MQTTSTNDNSEAQQHANHTVSSTADGGPIRALVIDDEVVIRSMVSACLAKSGWTVTEAESGEEGLAKYQEARPDLIVLDLLMPGRDGFEVCRDFRASGAVSTPILIMTGLEDQDAVHRAYESGATDFISKPIDYTVLPYRLRWILEASQSMARVKESERRLRRAQEVARMGSWELELNGATLEVSDEALRIFGVGREEFDGNYTTLLRHVHPKDRLKVNRLFSSALEGVPLSLEHRIVDGPNHFRHVRQEVETIDSKRGNESRAVIGTIQDVTDFRRTQQQLFKIHYFDELTGLANQHYIERQVARSTPMEEGERLAVFVVQIGNLKRIQGSFGKKAADRALTVTADRLVALVKAPFGEMSDAATEVSPLADTVARFGPSEFGVLRRLSGDASEPESFAVQVKQRLSEVLAVEGHQFVPGIEVGVALVESLEGPQEIGPTIENARNAYLLGDDESGVHFHSAELNARISDSFRLETDLRFALEKEEFRVYYQPKIDLNSGDVAGVEALVRWQHPERGLVAPSDFIPLAESSGLILEIGEWVLRQAVLDLEIHQKVFPDARLAMNLSTRQFYDLGLCSRIRRLLDDVKISPSSIELDVTEKVLLESRQLSQTVMEEMKALGVQIALDDFGTGYSSMSFLKDYPFDIVKFDRSFVRELTESHYSRALVASLVELSQCLGKKVVAEGIECEEELEVVREVKCNEAQGFFFCKPLPIDELVKWIGERSREAVGAVD